MAPQQSSSFDSAEMERLMLAGRREEAMQLAVASGEWASALLVAKSLGDTHWNKVISDYASSKFIAGSPLKTLFQIIAAQSNEAIFDQAGGFQDDNSYGAQANPIVEQWQRNLAIILSNRTPNDRQRVAHLGDMLRVKFNKIHAAHCCYLMASIPFQSHDMQGARLTLLGGDLQSQTLFHPHWVQCTEIMEAAHTEANAQYRVPQFQPYKLLYAMWLCEHGLLERGAHYLTSIKNDVSKASKGGYKFNPLFLAELDMMTRRVEVNPNKEGSGFFGRLGRSIFGGGDDASGPPALKKGTPVPQMDSPKEKETVVKPNEDAKKDATAVNDGDKPKGGFFSGLFGGFSGGGGDGGQLDDDTDWTFVEGRGWVQKGKEDEAPAAPPPPPPSAPGPVLGSAGGGGQPEGGGAGMMMAPPMPAAPASKADRKARLRNLRYVNTFGGGTASAGGTVGATPPTCSAAAPPVAAPVQMLSFAPPPNS